MGFIRRNLRDCTKPVKAAAYTTMARLTLEYASTVWDPHSSAETHKLEQVQRRAARFVHNNYTERTPGCVTHMVQNLGWQPLQKMFKYIQLKVHWNIYNAKTMYTALVTSMRRGVPAGSESYP
jgi:hypothetical protein